MRIDPKCKLELACSKDSDARYNEAITMPRLEGSVVIATNAHILAVVQVENDGEDTADGPIPVDALKESRKVAKGSGLAGTMFTTANGDGENVKLLDGRTYPRDVDGTFPQWRKVFPTTDNVFSVQINAKLLWKLSQALGNSGSIASKKDAAVTLHFFGNGKGQPNPNGGIAVQANGNTGIMMPMRDPDRYRAPDYLTDKG